jgi:hypothetical protein
MKSVAWRKPGSLVRPEVNPLGSLHYGVDAVCSVRKRMSSGGGPGLQSRVGGNRIVPGGFDSHPFRLRMSTGE